MFQLVLFTKLVPMTSSVVATIPFHFVPNLNTKRPVSVRAKLDTTQIRSTTFQSSSDAFQVLHTGYRGYLVGYTLKFHPSNPDSTSDRDNSQKGPLTVRLK